MSQYTMTAEISGSRNGEAWPPIGGTIDLPKEEGDHMVACGLAVPTPEDSTAEALGEAEVQRIEAEAEAAKAAALEKARLDGLGQDEKQRLANVTSQEARERQAEGSDPVIGADEAAKAAAAKAAADDAKAQADREAEAARAAAEAAAADSNAAAPTVGVEKAVRTRGPKA